MPFGLRIATACSPIEDLSRLSSALRFAELGAERVHHAAAPARNSFINEYWRMPVTLLTTRGRLAALLSALFLLLVPVACGSDDGDDQAPAGGTTTEQTTTSEETETTEEEQP